MTRQPEWPVWATFFGLLAPLLYYSQTGAYAWDEGFHLVTAQWIAHGKTPYFDFFFPQTPLNAYWNAMWMRVFGDTWRTAHAVAAVMTCVSILLAGGFVRRRTGDNTAAVVTMLLFGLNSQVVQFGPVGQAYGLCLFLATAGFVLVAEAVKRPSIFWSFGAGLASAAAASASLLTVPIAPLAWIWMLIANRTGSRFGKAVAFLGGCVVGSAPVWGMILQDPKRIFFDMFLYNMRYRTNDWEPGTVIPHDIGIVLSGIDSSQALVLGVCGIASLIYLWKFRRWDLAWSMPFYLCGTLALVLAIHIANARPTFERYFLFLVPWLAIPIGAGILAIPAAYRRLPIYVMLGITCLGLGKSLYEENNSFNWSIWEKIAAKVNEVTPAGATIQADEHVYLVARRTPPEGMEHENSHKPLPLTEEERKRLHIVSKPEIEKQIRSGYYNTIATCDDEKPVSKDIVAPLYRNNWELEQCTVYWGFQPPH